MYYSPHLFSGAVAFACSHCEFEQVNTFVKVVRPRVRSAGIDDKESAADELGARA